MQSNTDFNIWTRIFFSSFEIVIPRYHLRRQLEMTGALVKILCDFIKMNTPEDVLFVNKNNIYLIFKYLIVSK